MTAKDNSNLPANPDLDEAEQMASTEMFMEKTGELRDQFIDVLTAFSNENPGVTAEMIMAALGELLIQFSVSQVGKDKALHFMHNLMMAVDKWGDMMDPSE